MHFKVWIVDSYLVVFVLLLISAYTGWRAQKAATNFDKYILHGICGVFTIVAVILMICLIEYFVRYYRNPEFGYPPLFWIHLCLFSLPFVGTLVAQVITGIWALFGNGTRKSPVHRKMAWWCIGFFIGSAWTGTVLLHRM
jgi:uncharacterized membrane protein